MIKELFVSKSKSIGFGGSLKLKNTFTPLELSQIGIVYKCIKSRADAFASYEQKVMINGEEDLEHPIYDVFNSNPYTNWNELKKLRQKWLDTNGNAYIWVQEITSKEHQLWLLPSIGMNVDLGSGGENVIRSYTLVSDVQKTFKRDEIIHSKTLVPSRKFWENVILGKPELLNASLDLLQIEKERYDYYERKLRRDGTVPFALKTDIENVDQKRKLKEFFNSVVPAAYKALVVLNSAESLEPLTANNENISFDSEQIQRNITSIWGFPTPLITGEFANRNTADVLVYEFHNNTIYPLVKSFNEDLTRYFQWLYKDDRIEIVSDEPIYTDYEYYLKEMQFDLTHGLKSRNEIRLERNLNEIEGGDDYYIPNNLVDVNRINLVESQLTTTKNLNNDLAKTIVWKNIDRIRKPFDKRLWFYSWLFIGHSLGSVIAYNILRRDGADFGLKKTA
jgi:hypothetical protein